MSRPRFLADNDLNEQIVRGVLRREPGIVFARVRDFGLSAATDVDVVRYAAENGFITVSHDVNTMPAAALALVAASKPMAGLFMSRQSGPIGRIIDSLVLIWAATEAEEWAGQIVFLPI